MKTNKQIAEDKFSITERNPVDGCVRIIDNGTGKYIGINGKVFKAKSLTKAAEVLFRLRQGYEIQLGTEEQVKERRLVHP